MNNSLTVEDKMLLIKKMRNNLEENDSFIQRRSRALYGRLALDKEKTDSIGTDRLGELKIRFFLCLLILAIFILLDKTGQPVKNIRAKQVVSCLQSSMLPQQVEEVMQENAEAVITHFKK